MKNKVLNIFYEVFFFFFEKNNIFWENCKNCFGEGGDHFWREVGIYEGCPKSNAQIVQIQKVFIIMQNKIYSRSI